MTVKFVLFVEKQDPWKGNKCEKIDVIPEKTAVSLLSQREMSIMVHSSINFVPSNFFVINVLCLKCNHGSMQNIALTTTLLNMTWRRPFATRFFIVIPVVGKWVTYSSHQHTIAISASKCHHQTSNYRTEMRTEAEIYLDTEQTLMRLRTGQLMVLRHFLLEQWIPRPVAPAVRSVSK